MEQTFEQQTLEQKVEARIQGGIKIDFGLIFSDGWRIFKQVCWQVLIAAIIIGVVNWIVGTIIGLAIPVAGMDFDPSRYKPSSSEEIMEMYKDIFRAVVKAQSSPLAQLRNFIVATIAVLVSAPLQAGYMRNCREADKGKSNFGDMFSYYKNEYTGRIIGTGLILSTAGSLISFGLSFIPGVSLVIGMLISITTYLLFMFATPLIIFENATTKQALLLSMKLILNRFFPIAGFMLLCYILSLSGIILCCIGILITMAYLPVGNYLCYKCSMGFDDDVTEGEEGNNENTHWSQQPPTV